MRRAAVGASACVRVSFVLVIALAAALVDAETLGALGSILPPFISNHFEELVKAAADTCEALPLELLFSRQFTLELPHLDIVEYTRTSRRVYRASRAPIRLRGHHTPSLLLYIPGWWNTPTDESSEALVKALLQRHHMVLVLDTRLSFCRGYVASASRVKAVAHLLYKLIKSLYQDGLPLNAIHLIGFSLGAHVAGITGKLVQKNLNGKLERITALDPAKPCFARSSEYRLDKRDAKFIQVIHTSAGVLGLEQPLGHTDVYVNGVSVKQPECQNRRITLECDHAQAWKLYSASVMNERLLMGHKCRDWTELRNGQCSGNETVVGYSCSPTTRGMFLHRTEAKGQVRQTETRLKVYSPFDFLKFLF